jgi:hypothetical protein
VFTVRTCADAWTALMAVRPMARSTNIIAAAIENARRIDRREVSENKAPLP